VTLEVFSRDVVPVLQIGIGALGVISIALVWRQIRQTTLWNKLNSPHNFLDVERSERLTRRAFREMRRLGVDPHKLVSAGDADKIHDDETAQLAVKSFLNDVENICTAVRIGSVDEDCAYAVHSARVVEIVRRFGPFIAKVQDAYGDPELFIEQLKVAARWEKRTLETNARETAKLAELQKKLQKARGVREKVR